MDKSMAISLDSKIEDLFEEGRFGKFLEYCRMSDIVVLRQIEYSDRIRPPSRRKRATLTVR